MAKSGFQIRASDVVKILAILSFLLLLLFVVPSDETISPSETSQEETYSNSIDLYLYIEEPVENIQTVENT